MSEEMTFLAWDS